MPRHELILRSVSECCALWIYPINLILFIRGLFPLDAQPILRERGTDDTARTICRRKQSAQPSAALSTLHFETPHALPFVLHAPKLFQ